MSRKVRISEPQQNARRLEIPATPGVMSMRHSKADQITPSTIAPTKAIARYAVATLSLPPNVMQGSLKSRDISAVLEVNRE
jgi:hypothetical protein